MNYHLQKSLLEIRFITLFDYLIKGLFVQQ